MVVLVDRHRDRGTGVVVVAPPTTTLSMCTLCVALCLAAACASASAKDTGRMILSANLIGIGPVDCAHGPAGVRTILGAVNRARGDTFTINTRSPLADGSAEPQVFHVTVPGFVGFDRYLLPDAFVRVTFGVHRDGHCALRILIESVGQWDGVPSPVEAAFFFSANSQMLEPFAAAPFTVQPSRRDCTRLDVIAKSDGKPLAPQIVAAPTASACADQQAWSYWVASPPLR
jgi:hypothetical protein